MKSHIGVQTKGKPIIHSIVTTTAKDHDSTKTEELLHGDETSLFGDKAYDDKAIKRFCRNHNIFYLKFPYLYPSPQEYHNQKAQKFVFAFL